MSKLKINETAGERVYVIGDIHGCASELDVLINYLLSKEEISSNDAVIFLGDYVDRGKKSADVVELLLGVRQQCSNTVFLKGNHEEMFLDYLGFGGRLGEAFIYNGGVETLESYGQSVFSPVGEVLSTLPKSHLNFYIELDDIAKVDGYLFVHAGLNPKRSLARQKQEDIFWIRNEFLEQPHSFESTVVFGHTPFKEVFLDLPYKIGLDTGLVFGNKLTCLEINSGRLFQVKSSSKKVLRARLPE